MSPSTNQPVYKQIIAILGKALALLDEQGRAEVLQFILDSQNEDGGFRDRGGSSDLYYSLFGLLMLKVLKSEEHNEEQGRIISSVTESNPLADSILKLRQYTDRQSSSSVPGFIEHCCLVMLQKELKSKRSTRLQSLWLLAKSFWKERASINLSYRSFVLFITLEAVLPISALIKKPARRMMSQTVVNENSPCSEIAAKVFLNKMTGQPDSQDIELLARFADKSGGFKAFAHLNHADMLSTAVALFSLHYAGADFRLLKPTALDFIQSNYSSGAFLSGDGDQTEDVEYTFYGLLALGVLGN